MQLPYLSKTAGVGGTIKNSPEDFLVEEIMPDGTVLELDKEIPKKDAEDGKVLHFVLQKREWATSQALKTIAKRLRVSFRRFNFAGTKDKMATSTQLISCFALKKEELQKLKLKDVKINGMWYADDKVNLGDLLGNRFTIKVTDCENNEEKVKKIYDELEGKIPNYFGEQRFGSTRKNTHLIGQKILASRFEEAAMMYLTDTEGEDNSEAIAARKELSATRNFAAALKTFPKYLLPERSMLDHLSKFPNDYIGALRRLQRNILLMFVHAFQSYMFNMELSERLKDGELKAEEGEYYCGENSYGFPDIEKKDGEYVCMKLIGSESELSEREKQMLEEFNVRQADFNIRRMPEISSKGAYRTALVPMKEFEYKDYVFKFSLPSGSYATVAMREFIDKK